MIINRIINKAASFYYLRQERNQWFRDFEHFRSYARPVLSDKQKRAVKAYFKQYGFSVRTDWHNYYTYMTGQFSEKYIPADLMYTVIVPYLNYMPFELAYQDKNNYDTILPNVRKPETIARCKHGFYELGGGQISWYQ